MTNLEHYPKTADALKAWVAYCKCLIMHSSEEPKAFDVWCSQKYFDAQPKTESKKRRPFTEQELESLIGKIVRTKAGTDCMAVGIMTGFTAGTKESPVLCYIGGCYPFSQEYLLESNATIDGKPWGVEEGGAE